MTALARAVVAFVFLIVAWSAVRPVAAEARMGDHGKTVIFQNVYIKPDEVVNGDLNVVFGNAQIAGHVRGDVNIIFGKCEKSEGAMIDGQEHCLTDDAAMTFAPWLMNSSTLSSFADQDKRLFLKLGSSAIVLLVFLLFPVRMRVALDRVERHPGIAAAVGAVAFIAIIPIAILLLISIVGIPLIALELAAILAGVWLGTGAIALLVGRRLAELAWPSKTPSPLWALVLGLVVVSAAETVPYVGWAVTALVWLVGLGAAILAFIRSSSLASMRSSASESPLMRTIR